MFYLGKFIIYVSRLNFIANSVLLKVLSENENNLFSFKIKSSRYFIKNHTSVIGFKIYSFFIGIVFLDFTNQKKKRLVCNSNVFLFLMFSSASIKLCSTMPNIKYEDIGSLIREAQILND